MANRNVKLKNRNGDYLYPYTDNIPIASTSIAGKVQLDTSPTSGSNNAITSGAVFTALNSAISDSAMAHKAGNETFTGTKILQVSDDDAWLIQKANGDYTEETPTVQVAGAYRVLDKNGKIIGDVRFTRTTTGLQASSLVSRNAVTGNEIDCVISCIVDKDGNAYTSAPTPATNDNSTKIATTAFVKAQGYIGTANLATCHVVTQTYLNGSNWYRIWSDGWIEQGGSFNATNYTLTFPKAFTNANYIFLATNSDPNDDYPVTTTWGSKTTTTIYIKNALGGTAYSQPTNWYACGF